MKTTIKKKLLRSFILLLTLLYLVTGALTGIYVSSLLINQADRSKRHILEQSMQQVDVIFQMCDMTAKQIIVDEDIANILQKARLGNSNEKYLIISRANIVLSKYIGLNPFAGNISIISADDIVLSNAGIFHAEDLKARRELDWFSSFLNGSDNMTISNVYQAKISNATQSIVTVVYKYKEFSPQNKMQNYLMIDIPLRKFGELLNEDTNNHIFITNAQNQPITESLHLTANELATAKTDKNTYYLPQAIVLHEYMKSSHWNFYYFIPRSEFNRPIVFLLLVFTGLYILALAVAIIVASRRIKNIVAPIQHISSTMQNAYNGNLEVTTHVQSGDELEILSNCFNKLVKDLKEHVEKLVTDEKIKKEMQLDLLISQIHPHFIYNTLNSVVYLIEEEDGDTAIDVIYSLISMLQNIVKIGSKDVFSTVKEELELVDAYITIAKVRYPEIFTVETHCDASLLDVSIPKIIIQPLVENALLHGILPLGTKGKIDITIKSSSKDNWIDIIVADNGIGINSQKIETIWSVKRKHTSTGIGLSNIKNRISFLYNAAGHSFKIVPQKPTGTKVCISLPLE